MPEPEAYAEAIAACGADVDVWETTYHQRLTGPDPVLHWIGALAISTEFVWNVAGNCRPAPMPGVRCEPSKW